MKCEHCEKDAIFGLNKGSPKTCWEHRKEEYTQVMCSGNGDCLKQDGLNSYKRHFKIKCPYNCTIKKCPNDENHDDDERGDLFPEWYFNRHGGNCYSCAKRYGHGFKKIIDFEECPVCLEEKKMTLLRCNHKICWSCWSNICNNNESETITKCPLCRKTKW